MVPPAEPPAQPGVHGAGAQAHGMFSEGNRGLYDRFRGRLIWPILRSGRAGDRLRGASLTRTTRAPSNLNTPETQLYKKSQALYGIDLAKKRPIAKTKQVVGGGGLHGRHGVPPGRVTTAVATRGMASRQTSRSCAASSRTTPPARWLHLRRRRRRAEGRAAPSRRTSGLMAETYVAVEPNGMDPCDLRLARGDVAVRDLGTRTPLFESRAAADHQGVRRQSLEGRLRATWARPSSRRPRPPPAPRLRELGRLGIETDEATRGRPRRPVAQRGGSGPVARGLPGSGEGPGSASGAMAVPGTTALAVGSRPRDHRAGSGPRLAGSREGPALT
ncbi:hypothetical protein QJS66_07015 [Kocuria rhizophila]|nr:hypothetical protein QJS66_07015 [Kocuria rhizophila]